MAELAPVSVKNAGSFVNELEGRWTFMYWMKAKTTRQHSAAFQKVRILLAIDLTLMTRHQCILGYISDVNLCATLCIIVIIPLILTLLYVVYQ